MVLAFSSQGLKTSTEWEAVPVVKGGGSRSLSPSRPLGACRSSRLSQGLFAKWILGAHREPGRAGLRTQGSGVSTPAVSTHSMAVFHVLLEELVHKERRCLRQQDW